MPASRLTASTATYTITITPNTFHPLPRTS